MMILPNHRRIVRQTVRWSNADILTWDSVGFFQLFPPFALNTFLALKRILIEAHIVGAYTNIDAAASGFFSDDTNTDSFASPDNSNNFFSKFLAPAMGKTLPLETMVGPQPFYDPTGLSVTQTLPDSAFAWIDAADLFANGGIVFGFTNGGSGDLTGGNVNNFVDFIMEYDIVSF